MRHYFIVAHRADLRPEVIDEAENEKDAETLRAEYQLAYGKDFNVYITEDNRWKDH